MVPILTARGNGGVEARDAEIGVGGGRSKALLHVEPWRGREGRHAQGFLQVMGGIGFSWGNEDTIRDTDQSVISVN